MYDISTSFLYNYRIAIVISYYERPFHNWRPQWWKKDEHYKSSLKFLHVVQDQWFAIENAKIHSANSMTLSLLHVPHSDCLVYRFYRALLIKLNVPYNCNEKKSLRKKLPSLLTLQVTYNNLCTPSHCAKLLF